MEPEKRKRGGQPGNQNARTHGFYSRVLDEDQARDLAEARGIEGISEEISLIRVKIKSLLRNDPENIKLIMAAFITLAKLLRSRYPPAAPDKKGLGEAIANVLKDVALPLGISLKDKFK